MSLVLLFSAAGSGTLSATGIASSEAFGSPTVNAGSVALSATGVASMEAFGSPTVSGTVALAVAGILSGEAFGTPVAVPLTTLAAIGIASFEIFGTPIVSGAVALSVAGIGSGEAFGTAPLTGTISLAVAGIGSGEAFGTVLLYGAALFVTGIASGEAFGMPVLVPGSGLLLALAIGSGEAFGAPLLSINTGETLTFADGSTFYSSALSQEAINTTLQNLTCQMLGIDPFSDPEAYSRVRLDWLAQGQPGWSITEDRTFIRTSESDSDYSRIRDKSILARDGVSVSERYTYSRTWQISWVLYGPNSFDMARQLKSSLYLDWPHDILAASNLYLTGSISATRRGPELFAAQWWDKSEVDIYLMEGITEIYSVASLASAEVILEEDTGVVAVIQA